jgi:putative transposase
MANVPMAQRPAAVLRDLLVARKCTYPNRIGRPPLPDEVAALIERFARDNPSWGYQRVRREALIDRVGVRDLRLRPVVAGR